MQLGKGETSEAETSVSGVASATGTSRALLNLTPYNGTGSLETYLAKFENIASYLQWGSKSRCHHIQPRTYMFLRLLILLLW